MKVSPFTFPRSNRGARLIEAGIVSAGIAVAILAVWLQLAAHDKCQRQQTADQFDRLGLLIELAAK